MAETIPILAKVFQKYPRVIKEPDINFAVFKQDDYRIMNTLYLHLKETNHTEITIRT